MREMTIKKANEIIKERDLAKEALDSVRERTPYSVIKLRINKELGYMDYNFPDSFNPILESALQNFWEDKVKELEQLKD